MAIISKIQKHAYILVGIIALCIITFLYETINPNLNMLRSSSSFIGKVNGETLEYEQFKKELETKEQEMRVQKGVQTLTEQETTEIKNQIWGQFLMKNIVMSNMNKLGLAISPKEIVEITKGKNIDPSLMQIPAFSNQSGQYDPMLFTQFINNIKQDDPSTPPGTREKQWLAFENQMLDNRKISKFNAILENGLYVPKWMSDYDSKMFSTNTNISYVTLPYSTVDMNTMKYEKSEVETYFNENKNKYVSATPSVKLSLVAIPLVPSTADSIEIFTKFNTKLAAMTASTNDTNYFRAYGDKGYDMNYYQVADLGQHPKMSEMFSAAPRSIIGPYIDKDNVKAFKILGRKNISDSVFVKAITISFQDVAQSQDGQMKRLKLVDSIFKMVDTLNMDFDQVAAKYSADRGQTPPNWITKAEKMWDPEIFINGGTQKYFKSPSQREGVIRILKVLNFPARIPAVQLGEISLPYAPSTTTQQATFNSATSFIQKCKTATDIEKNAKSNPNFKSSSLFISKDNTTIEGIEGNGREAIRWAFESKSGEISNMIQIGNNYVYFGNLGQRSKENIKFADVENEILPDFKTEKAFKLIAEKMSGANLQEVATKNKITVMTKDSFSFATGTINNMPEPTLVAVSSTLAANKISKPIKGSGGVYRIQTTKVNPSAVSPAEELNTKSQLNKQFKTLQGLLEGILNRYDVDDNRANIF
jgi:peptidyl-prolyl cis-trans isomerase D